MRVEAANLCYSHGCRPILKGLNFSRGGGITALLGENGSGKSTLLSCLAGLRETPSVLWEGIPAGHRSTAEQARLRTFVPQSLAFDSAAAVYDFVLSGRNPWFEWNESPHDHQYAEEMLELFELIPLAFRRLADISGGERQRAVLARAFAQNTPLLLLDEPLNNLDLRFQIRFMNLLQQRAREANSLIFIVLHDINAALNWCGSSILLKEGQIIAEGPIAESLTGETVRRMLGVEVSFIPVGGGRRMVLPPA
ncbi:MAG: hypothetical protein B0D92_00880 [Spirochaeta sp. LUC14_002_19_P3]|nr:MAG: hypothetical protein B0D92_00880 [Spirochaeta sp. LUC14_002_19_P3]